MLAPRHQMWPRIRLALLVVLLAACTSVPVPTLAIKPASTPADLSAKVRPTCPHVAKDDYLFSAIWSPAASIVALVSSKGICLYDAISLHDLRFIETKGYWGLGLVFSPDGKLLASIDETSDISLWDVATGRKVRALSRADDRRIMEGVFAPDSKTLVSKSYASVPEGQSIQVWDVATGQERRAMSAMYLERMVFSPDSQWLVLTGRESKVWKIATDQVLPLPFTAGEIPSFAPAFTPDSKSLAWAGDAEGTAIQLWDLSTGRVRQTLHGHTEHILRLVFSPDGQLLASSAQWPDMTIRLWDVSTGQELYTLGGHTCAIFGVIFAPDGKTLASSDCSGSIKLWNVKTGREWLAGKVWDVNDILLFSPAGKPPLAPGKVIDFVETAQQQFSFSADGQRRISTSWQSMHNGSLPVFELSDVTTGRHWPLN